MKIISDTLTYDAFESALILWEIFMPITQELLPDMYNIFIAMNRNLWNSFSATEQYIFFFCQKF